MPDLNFEVVGAEAPAFAAVPTLIFKLRIENAIDQERIFTITLRCQIQINVTRRRYSPEAQARLWRSLVNQNAGEKHCVLCYGPIRAP